MLEPIQSRAPWVIWGLIAQVLGLGGVAVVMWHNIRDQGIAGHVTAEMIKLAWRSQLHTRSGLIVLIAGSAIYAAGSVLMTRPYMTSPLALFVAVPVAAVAGMLVFGVLVVVVTVLVLLLEDNIDISFFDFGFGGSRRKKGGG